ncbi:MAG: sel1 repeat family protein [Cyclobacteriaceae bacterium]
MEAPADYTILQVLAKCEHTPHTLTLSLNKSMNLNRDIWQDLLEKSNRGDSEAQNDLAMWFEEGFHSPEFHIEQDFQQAAKWYLESAKSGNKYSQDAISRLYSLGQGIDLNIDKAIKWAIKAIDQGNATAAYNLGTIYRDLLEFKKAFEYYTLALKMDDKSSLLQIGLCHYFGIGTMVDFEKANQLFEQITTEHEVTEYEIDEANYMIGFSYLHGNGRQKSIKDARKHFLLAHKDEGHEQSILILNLISRNNDNTS